MAISLRDKINRELVLLDGAFGTYAHRLGLEDEHFTGHPGCMEYLSLSRPGFVRKIHEDYLAAGADAVETNTFGGNSLKLAEYGLSEKVYDINVISTRLARKAADEASSASSPRYVVGTMGPTGKLPSSTDPALGDVTYAELKKIFHDQALGIIDGGADALLVETSQDLLEMKAAVNGAKNALKERRKDLVLMAQCTLSNNGRMLLGTEISAVMATMAYMGVDVVGVNCGTGPVEMEKAIEFLSGNSPAFISCVPNAGLPVEKNGKTVFPMKPGEMAEIMADFVKKYRLDVVGGCCGTGPEHISAMRGSLGKSRKRKRPANTFYASFYKGYDLRRVKRPIRTGERINTQGSRRMKDLLLADDYDGIVELGKLQQGQGADVLDVCAVLTERKTEKKDEVTITRLLSESVRVPLMIDSTDADVIEGALHYLPGTPFINSVNLEDGGKKARAVFTLAKEHAGFIVCLAIDEKGMARTVKRKIEIAERIYGMAVGEYGIEPHRLLFDMLTFSLGTGEKEYRDSAVRTYEAIKALKKKYPGVLTVLGVSNISFGLAKEARRALNMAFLHHAVKAGLDMAIINPAGYLEYRKIPAKQKKLAEDLVFNRSREALHLLVAYFEGRKPVKGKTPGKEKEALTIEEKLKRCVMDRDNKAVIPLIDRALEKYKPEEIINVILMDAMKQVGDKLDSGEMVLPYVLQSAEVMKKAIEHLSVFMPKGAVGKRGKVLLATVFGDVHDIGKNLVKMVLQNNGFTVIDLGKQVPVEKIVREAKRRKVDAVGLSALLVSTARYMKTCIQSMHDAGLEYPVLVGGAPVNRSFARDVSALKDESVYKGGVFYARDAFTGLKLIQALTDPEARSGVMKEYREQFGGNRETGSPGKKAAPKKGRTGTGAGRVKAAAKKKKAPEPPFWGGRPLVNIPADEVFPLIDERMLFELAWGAKLKDKKERARIIETDYRPLLQDMQEESIRKGWLDLKAVYGYFKCTTREQVMDVLDAEGKVLETLAFPRERGGKNLSLADYFDPPGDVVAFQAVTVGGKINRAIAELTEKKDLSRAFFLHGFSVHLAEALAAYVHGLIRRELGLKKGQGKRYSPGYPLWRHLEDQEKIFRLLDVEKYLGVRLTEGHQMVPEQSTTAMIVHNPQAAY